MEQKVTSATATAVAAKTHQVEFTGKNGEYFRLWLVNLLLTLVTLGIYSAWAKVRNHQYMYGHTSVDTHRFVYLAKPLQILKGRLIGVAVIVAASLLAQLHAAIQIAVTIAFLVSIPWLLLQAIRFGLRMTAYRNVRFDFTGNYLGVLWHMIILPFVCAIPMGLGLPWALKQLDQYIHENLKWGDQTCTVKLQAGEYYLTALVCFGLAVIIGILASLAAGVGVAITLTGAGMAGLFIGYVLAYAVVIILGQFVAGFWSARIRNHIMANMAAGNVATFESTARPLALGTLMLTNILLMLVTLGLAFPVTRVRMARYLAQSTQVTIDQQAIESVVNRVGTQDSAFGEETADLLDLGATVLG
ncbi:YjgN family protein [Oceanobacter mangrovi]|uniref:YjgN family protein n=1 Tax=Oceanobacter mangrovi TaxID=2862510 RepID=UPI001C8F0B89|nr:YjgN family protein [Oceanobacter mangrovi]